VIRSRGIAAGVGPTDRNGEVARLAGVLAHDVSILLAISPPATAALDPGCVKTPFLHDQDPKRTLFRTRSDTLSLMTKMCLMRRIWCHGELRLSW
jgi:hypothetical protein